MSIDKLHIFSKNTDANASIRGYNYQTLKTLESWVVNFLNKADDEIYCDFEEDIFQKNHFSQTAKFRQLKLYSSNFSFKSEEIEKCISHFFMLNVKTDYKLLDKEFIFEANTTVAAKYKDNDAELLRKWVANQNNLQDDLLKLCSEKAKSIVSEYVYNQEKELKDKVEESTIKEAISIFEALTENNWKEFTKKIKWLFANQEPDLEFLSTILNIESLILKLPHNINKDNLESAFGVLYMKVSLKASEQKPEDRKLTVDELNSTLISLGTKDDNWYLEIYEKWKDIQELEYFRIGEFYEILNAVRYCRRHAYLSNHDAHWLDLLKFFTEKLTLRNEFKREAIYEYIWLRLRPDEKFTLPLGDLFGSEGLIKFYFSDFAEFRNADSLEDAQSLLQIISAAKSAKKIKIKIKEIENWFKELFQEINNQLRTIQNPNEKCHLLEELGTLILISGQKKKENADSLKALKYYEEILAIIDTANLYNATILSDRINQYIGLFINIDPVKNSDIINALEIFSEKLDFFVQKRNGEHISAKAQVKRAINYINSNDPFLLLKALNYFHKAKDFWYSQETIGGYVLGLLNISQLYNAIGLNFASKYYALACAWVSVYNGENKLYKRIADALGMIFYSDFQQGAWLSSISDFQLFINARDEFDPNPLNLEKEELVSKSIADFSILLFATPILSSQFQVFISLHLKSMGYLADDFVLPLIEMLEKDYRTEERLRELCVNKINDFPLNDSGKIRIVRFYALGSLWEISFNNDYQMNSIAEEFLSILQVMLAEISLSESDFHLVKGVIKIELELTEEKMLLPEELPSNTEYKWKVFLNYFDNTDPNKINLHTAKNSVVLFYILNRISLLKNAEFKDLFESLFKKNSLASKTLSANAYQKMFRLITSKEGFDSQQRELFLPVITAWNLPSENRVMRWKDNLSIKYNHEKALEFIHNRFKHSYGCIYITLGKLKEEKEFRDYINELRKVGFLDWQIILAIMNFIIDYKAQVDIKDLKFVDENEYMEALQKAGLKFLNMDEKDCYIYFPLKAFKTENFKMQLTNYPVYILKAFGLENKSGFPNFNAIKEFLDIRFNMKTDINDLENPLSDIK